MSKSAPAELRLNSIFGLASARAELANWPEPTRKWGQLIKLFMTRLCCKQQTHTDTHTHPTGARWWSMLMCVLCGFSAFSLLYSFSSASAFSVRLSFCPFVPLPSSLLSSPCPCHVGFIFAMRRATEVRGYQARNRPHSRANMLCACVIPADTVATGYAKLRYFRILV